MFDGIFDVLEDMFWQQPRRLVNRQVTLARSMFLAARGTAGLLLVTNLLWMVPISFMQMYLRLFMAEQGLTSVQIGTLASLQLAAQVAGSLLGGWIPERLGRQRALLVLDGILWPSIMATFMLARGYPMFLLGSLLLGFQAVTWPSFISLLLTGVPRDRSALIFALEQLSWMAGGLMVSFTGLFVDRIGVSASCRGIFLGGIVLMAIGWTIRYRRLGGFGPRLRPTGPDTGLSGLLRAHAGALRTFLSRPALLRFLGIQILVWCVLSTTSTYLSLYLTDVRGTALAPGSLALLLVTGNIATAAAILLIAPRIRGGSLLGFLFLGTGLTAAYYLLLLSAPAGALGTVLVATAINAVGWGVFRPAMQGFWTNLMSDAERPRLLSLAQVLVTLLALPVPTLGGLLYGIQPALAIALNLAFLAGIGVLLAWIALDRKNGRKPGLSDY